MTIIDDYLDYQIKYEILNKPDNTYNDNILGKFFPKDLEN